MKTVIQGKAFIFGANIDTDQIYPGRYLELTDPEDLAKHVMEGADPDFVKKFQPGDIIVASTNFGCGSSREHAAVALKAIGTGAVLASSFGRIFYRNAINLGLPLLICPRIHEGIRRGDLLRVDLASGQVVNVTSGKTIIGEPLSDFVLNILKSRGIKSLIRNQYGQQIQEK